MAEIEMMLGKLKFGISGCSNTNYSNCFYLLLWRDRTLMGVP